MSCKILNSLSYIPKYILIKFFSIQTVQYSDNTKHFLKVTCAQNSIGSFCILQEVNIVPRDSVDLQVLWKNTLFPLWVNGFILKIAKCDASYNGGMLETKAPILQMLPSMMLM